MTDNSRKIFKVAVENAAFGFDKLFDYEAKPGQGEALVGCRVLVPFGRGKRPRQGIVF